jgi:hypothetical protein
MTGPDLFVARGFGSADGDYEFDWFGLINVGTADALDLREQHRITSATGVKPADYLDAFTGLHPAFLVSLASVVFARNGKTVGEERIWNSRISYGDRAELDVETVERNVIVFAISARTEEEAEADPPMAPPTDRSSSTSGGADSKPRSGQPVPGLSRIGRPESAAAVDSAPVTSAG